MPDSTLANTSPVTIPDNNKWTEAVERMTKLTQSRTMTWRVVSVSEAKISSKDEVYGAYDSSFANRSVRLLESDLPKLSAPPMSPALKAALGLGMLSTAVIGNATALPLPALLQAPRSTETVRGYSLLLIDANGAPLFAFPRSVRLGELLRAIKEQLADVDTFLNALLAETSKQT